MCAHGSTGQGVPSWDSRSGQWTGQDVWHRLPFEEWERHAARQAPAFERGKMMSENNVTVLEVDTKDVGSEFISGLRAAAKAKTDPKGKVTALLAGATAALGDAKTAQDETMKGEALVAEGQALLHRSETNLRRWTITAQVSREAGVSARNFASAIGAKSPSTLGRLANAADIFDAAKANKTPVTIGRACFMANKMGAGEVTATVAAYNGAEEGTDPETGIKSAKAAAKAPTVEQFVQRVDALASVLSTLLEGDYATPKADTLPALEAAVETLAKMGKQTVTLTAQVRKASRTPKAKAA